MDNISLLTNLGFTEYEARTYVALSDLGPSTAKEISNYSKLPKNKTYEMLLKLEKKKKVITLPITPRKYKLLDINQLKTDIEEKKKSLLDIEKNLSKFIEESSRPKFNDFKEIFWIIRGKKAIIDKMAAQNALTKKEILSINRLSISNSANLRQMKKAITSGVKVKMLVPNIKDNQHIKKRLGVRMRVAGAYLLAGIFRTPHLF